MMATTMAIDKNAMEIPRKTGIELRFLKISPFVAKKYITQFFRLC